MTRAFNEARVLIRQRAIEYPEDPEIAGRLWSLLLKNPNDARHLLDFILREVDRIGRIEEREAIKETKVYLQLYCSFVKNINYQFDCIDII